MEIVVPVVGVLAVAAVVVFARLNRSVSEGLTMGVITWIGLLALGAIPGYLLVLTSGPSTGRWAFAVFTSWAFWAGHAYLHIQKKPQKSKIALWTGFGLIVVTLYLPGLTPILVRWEEQPRHMYSDLLLYPPDGLPWPQEAEYHFLRDRLSGRTFMVLCSSRDFVSHGEVHRAGWLKFAVKQYAACNQYMGALEIYASRPVVDF